MRNCVILACVFGILWKRDQVFKPQSVYEGIGSERHHQVYTIQPVLVDPHISATTGIMVGG